MAATLEELKAIREQMTALNLSTGEIDNKIKTLQGVMAIKNDYPAIVKIVQEFIEPMVCKWGNNKVTLSFKFDEKGLSIATSDLEGSKKIFYQRDYIPGIPSHRDRDTSRYRVNGSGPLKKKEMVLAFVDCYIHEHSGDDEMTIKRAIMSLGVNITKFIRTKEEYDFDKMKSRDKNFDMRTELVSWENGILYVSTQWSIDRSDELMEKVNAKPWGIKIEKIQ